MKAWDLADAVHRLVTSLAVATGKSEAQIRLEHGLDK